MNEKLQNSPYQLGLPPMELAETNDRDSNSTKKCLIHPLIQKLVAVILIIALMIGAYIFLFNVLQGFDCGHYCSTEIVILNHEPANVTIENRNSEIYILFKNKTQPEKKRLKREASDEPEKLENVFDQLETENVLKVRDVITNNNVKCNEGNQEKICKNLVTTIKSIVENDKKSVTNSDYESTLSVIKDDTDILAQVKGITSTIKRQTNREDNLESVKPTPELLFESRDPFRHALIPIVAPSPPAPLYPAAHGPLKMADTCLLAKLLKQHYPHALHDITQYSPPHYEGHPLPYSRYLQPAIPAPLFHARAANSPRRLIHPQDMAIQMDLLKIQQSQRSSNSTRRDADCVLGNMPCGNSEKCILESQWCDGKVDCSDASDESSCGCKSRVDKSRLCDGYFDCPFGEDEMGCDGCSESSFSCMDMDNNMNSQSTCFTKEERCNNVADCPNSRDELDCTMLAPTLHNTALFAVSNTEGYLHRNFKGEWYAVCKNPYQWAHDACRRETGLVLRPPFIQVISIDPMLKVSYLNTGDRGLIHMSNTCFNNSAIYVTCPDLLCGTRIMPAAQILKGNIEAENHLFGRNKRFLLRHPYPLVFYNNRVKRGISNTGPSNFLDLKTSNDKLRNKRTESRVVGGTPSQPAAWPWMIAMYRDGMFHCGGVILTQSWVVSAAHCVDKFWNHYFEIRVGMLRRFSFSPQEQNHRVTHVIVNKLYNHEDMRNDMSLLKVEPEIQFSRWVRPICLPGIETAGQEWLWGPPSGTMCTAVGWGATVEHGPDPDHLREVDVPLWSHCKHREDRAGHEICAGLNEGGRDACQGDSGGPLLCKNPLNPQQWYMAGIVSHGDGCGRKGEPGVYTRVSLFVKWIKYHIFSEHLPVTQPKQECPGFKCVSGLLKCLPTKRVCDKIVDCLGAEDEINCDAMRTSHLNDNLFLATSPQETVNFLDANLHTKESEHTSIKKQTDTKSSLREANNDIDSTITSTLSSKSSETNTDENTNINDDELMREQELKTVSSTESQTTNTELDFTKASTLEVPNEKNTDDTFDDNGTVEPFEFNTNMERTARGDLGNSVSITLPKNSLESFNSLIDKSNFKEADIQEDWDDEPSTTKSPETTDVVVNITDTTMIPTSVSTMEIIKPANTATATESSNKLDSTAESTSTNEDIPESKDLLIALPDSEFTSSIPHKDTSEHQEEPPEDLDNKNINDKVKEIVSYKLEPAKVKRQHLVQKDFECRHIPQVIPYHQRCDRKADCEDGTDELSCTCVDYIFRFDRHLLCDSVFDCADGQDEMDCYSCPENYFLCHRSQQCLPMQYVCDENPNCPLGEDELECFALTNGQNIEVDIAGKPKLTLEGFITKKHTKDWHVVCDENLNTELQELAAGHICRYLGFSSANRYLVKHINVKDTDILKSIRNEDSRNRRNAEDSIPVHFAFRKSDDTSRHVVIKEPQVLKEECVPNVTKTCMSLYVYCDHALYTENFEFTNEILYNREADVKTHMWPWVAKIFVDGDYKCSGVLVDLSWALVSHSCLWDTILNHHHITVIVGSHRILPSNTGMYEQTLKVDAKKDLYHTKAVLLHLHEPVQYTRMVKPMTVSSYIHDEKPTMCVAIGQDENNTTVGMFVEETKENCDLHNRCFVKTQKENICEPGMVSHQQWAGIISCHSENGWYPFASFVDSRGECGADDRIVGSEIGSLKNEIKFYEGRAVPESSEINSALDCDGVRCRRGTCIKLAKVCDGVPDCEDQNDEQDDACQLKTKICTTDPYQRGCDCSLGELKCHNGKCVAKELYRDGRDDCGDGSDEPVHMTCAHYLARVKPSRLCDGVLHCEDRTDEDPMFCKCFAKKGYRCNKAPSGVDLCVSHDVVCDGVKDCPNGEDEQTCLALKAPEGSTYGTGQVMHRSHGVWYTKCYQTQNHTRLELENICRELGFISGHAKQLKAPPNLSRPSNYIIGQFSEVMLNNNTSIKIRNTDEPLAKSVVPESMDNCYPVYIECL